VVIVQIFTGKVFFSLLVTEVCFFFFLTLVDPSSHLGDTVVFFFFLSFQGKKKYNVLVGTCSELYGMCVEFMEPFIF